MKPRAHGQGFAQSMVPMADMLTSTVGVVIFMLMFSVLAAGGATALKRLPMEHETDASPEHFVCTQGKVYIIDRTLAAAFVERAGPLREAVQSLQAFNTWAERFRGLTETNGDTVVTATARLQEVSRGYLPHAAVHYKLRPGGGEGTAMIGGEGSRYRKRLASLDAHKSFAHFIVMPDGIDAFSRAREVALQQGLRTGWTPQSDDGAVSLSVLGGGWKVKPTD